MVFAVTAVEDLSSRQGDDMGVFGLSPYWLRLL